MFWSRETGTVRGLVYDLKDIIKWATWRKGIILLDKVKNGRSVTLKEWG